MKGALMSTRHRVTAILLVATLAVAPTLALAQEPVVAFAEAGTAGVLFCAGAGLVALVNLVFGDKDKFRDKNDELILREGPNCREQATVLPGKSQWTKIRYDRD
jgi:hypothetical protein